MCVKSSTVDFANGERYLCHVYGSRRFRTYIAMRVVCSAITVLSSRVSMGSGLEAFSRYPAHGSFAALAVQPTA